MTLSAGIHFDVPPHVYHADPAPEPSLSASIAHVLVTSSPAHAYVKHPRLNPDYVEPEPVNRMMHGQACHRLVLRRGEELAVGHWDAWRTKEAKAFRDEALANRKIPILTEAYERAKYMAFDFEKQIETYSDDVLDAWLRGQSEVAAIWQDHGVWCRSLIDRFVVIDKVAWRFDYKTTEASADPQSVARRVFDMGYDLQAAFNARGIFACLPHVERVRSLVVTQEVQPPYALSVVELAHETMDLAEKKAMTALAIWAGCREAGRWPAFPPVVAGILPPGYHETAWLEREMTVFSDLDTARFARPIDKRQQITEFV